MTQPRAAGRSIAALAWGAAVAAGDLAPPGVRYGYLHPIAARLFAQPTPVLEAVPGISFVAQLPQADAGSIEVSCVLVADRLDGGGVGGVVEMLALGLRARGVRPIVVCPGEGERVARLRDNSVEVRVVPEPTQVRDAIAEIAPDVVQLHSAPMAVIDELLNHPGVPLVPVLHNTEIHYDGSMWERTGKLFARAAKVVAVSDIVRRFHLRRLPQTPPDRVCVIANGAMPLAPLDPDARPRARRALEEALQVSLDAAPIFCSLARYDSQKNVTGLVSGFLRSGAEATLVVAGDTSDWLEYRRAHALRSTHPRGWRVHLLGRSDPAAILAAADAFILDSFFEGWPLATTEAVAVGLPVIMSDTGGAREILTRAPEGSVVIANPAAEADAVTDSLVRRARRQASAQRNAAELGAAVRTLALALRASSRRTQPALKDTSYQTMVSAHATLIHGLAPRALPDRAEQDGVDGE